MKEKNELTIVIPTYNEEKYIETLLNDIIFSSFKNYHVIICDNNSTDKTSLIVKKKIKKNKRFKLVSCEKKGPSAVRNYGAKYATSKYILFLDSDSRISKTYLKNTYNEIRERKLEIANHYLFIENGKLIDYIFISLLNFIFRIMQFFSPIGNGSGIIIKTKLHEKISGFDETITVAEDLDYQRRASFEGKFKMLKIEKTKFNLRRFEKEGRITVYSKWFIAFLYHLFKKNLKKYPFKYEFGNY